MRSANWARHETHRKAAGVGVAPREMVLAAEEMPAKVQPRPVVQPVHDQQRRRVKLICIHLLPKEGESFFKCIS